jgi:hypothetical protein
VIKLLTRTLAVIVWLDAVGLAVGCVLRRRRGRYDAGRSPRTGLPGDDNALHGAHHLRRVSG